jgi:hypothetical protein
MAKVLRGEVTGCEVRGAGRRGGKVRVDATAAAS